MSVDDAFILPAPGTEPLPQLPAGYEAAATAHGTLLTGPDGGQLLYAAPAPPAEGAAPTPPVDVVLADVVASPHAVGVLRRDGVVVPSTAVIGLGGDHRVSSPAELERRCRLWGVLAPSDNQILPCPPKSWPPSRPRGPYRAMVLGGARSGKSAEAEQRLLAEPDVTYVATGPAADSDPEWARRVAAHAERRPAWWRTEETLDVASVLQRATGAVLFDCVGTWLAGTMDACGVWAEEPPPCAKKEVWRRVDDLVSAWRRTQAYVVAVSSEVGSGVVPATPSGGLFRDWLGRLNQMLAAESEEAVLTVAGRVLELE